MRSYSVQRRMTQIPACLKHKQNYCTLKNKELCKWLYNKPSGSFDKKLCENLFLLDLPDLELYKKNVIEKIRNDELVKQNGISVQDLAIKTINESLLKLQELLKLRESFKKEKLEVILLG